MLSLSEPNWDRRPYKENRTLELTKWHLVGKGACQAEPPQVQCRILFLELRDGSTGLQAHALAEIETSCGARVIGEGTLPRWNE